MSPFERREQELLAAIEGSCVPGAGPLAGECWQPGNGQVARAFLALVERGQYFFGAHGSLWVVCRPADPEAEGFGPCYTARFVELAEQELLGLGNPQRVANSVSGRETAWVIARRLGRLDTSGKWDLLTR